jgi:GDP/UDP-N,N'-diacetylbacillosamine 2-epimerase (hydrolysing)
MSKEDFEASINCKLKQKNYMVTFHPVTLDKASAETQFKELIDALDEQEDSLTIFTKPNADNDGRIIITMIDEYVAANRDKAIAFTSLGQLRYLSAMQYLDAVIGNSSSGLIEVPSFKIPTINIGDRQKGRIAGATIINCEASKPSIITAINQALSNEFITSLKTTKNPYGEKNSSDLIVNEILDVDLNGLLKKKFYNL